MHWTTDDEKFIKRILDGDCFINGNSKKCKGGLLFGLIKKFEYIVTKTDKDTDGNLLMLDIRINDA